MKIQQSVDSNYLSSFKPKITVGSLVWWNVKSAGELLTKESSTWNVGVVVWIDNTLVVSRYVTVLWSKE
jgi:hypothetical protein